MTTADLAETKSAVFELATNLRWSWDRSTRAVLDELPGALSGIHPLVTLMAVPQPDLDEWLTPRSQQIAELHAELAAVVATTAPAEIAYFSPEFGIAAEVPQYSGGLGILAGDHLKSASDLALPLIGIGLLYREGFFRQGIADAKQTERYETVDPAQIGAIDTGVAVDVDVDGENVTARVWRQHVGATQLLLLDTDVESNSAKARSITDRLYSGGRRHRLDQELILGVGGVRALRALGIAPTAFHLNEGHACFLLLELLAEQVESGASFADATAAVRAQTLFTTHTPVPAGIDRFERDLITPDLLPWAQRLGVSIATLLDWGVLPNDGPNKPFNTAAFAFEFADRANGVSQLHAEVSKDLFAELPRSASLVGITNGVHARTWVDGELQDLYDQTLGAGWINGDATAWESVGQLDRERFEQIRDRGRQTLVDMVADRTGTELDPDRCVIGFARRFATYKRAALLLRNREGLARAIDAGAQFVFAGKAHPADDEGKAVLSEVAAFADSIDARSSLVVVPDYDIDVAQVMYAGCDVWLNNPIRPREASGTSGEKAALNGVLNCSILDGWWADWYTDGIGWAIPVSDETDPTARDDAEATALNAMLADEVVPSFGTTDWWTMTTAMLGHLGPLVTAGRMVAEYEQRLYGPIRNV